MLDPSYEGIRTGTHLPHSAVAALNRNGFFILHGPYAGDITQAYDEAMASGTAPDLKVGSTTARLSDLVNRSSAFDPIFLHPPLLEACAHFIGAPFKLSSLLGRTLHPHAPAQALHQDLPDDSPDRPMLGFIYTVDPFRTDNGATRFLHPCTGHETLACTSAGCLIVFNASVTHGHGANQTGEPRRSIQGCFVRREARSACDFAASMGHATLGRLSPLARYLLALEDAPM
jgi:hypothetical protein